MVNIGTEKAFGLATTGKTVLFRVEHSILTRTRKQKNTHSFAVTMSKDLDSKR